MKVLKLIITWLDQTIEFIDIALKKREARLRYYETGKRHWVLKNEGKYIVVSRAEIKGSKIHIDRLLDHAIYKIG